MRIAWLCACVLLAAACGGPADAPTQDTAGEDSGQAAQAPDDLDVLYALLVEPFEPRGDELARASAHATPPELGEAVADLFATAGVDQEVSGQVRDTVWTLARPIMRGREWVDADGRRAVARAELEALLGDAYDDFMRQARDLRERAEGCLPDCEERDLWPQGRPVGAAEEAVAEACVGVAEFAPDQDGHDWDTRSRHQEEGEVAVEVAAAPEGFTVVEELRGDGHTVSERGNLSPEAATGWHVLLAAGDRTRDDPHVHVQSVLAPAPEVCHLLRRDARHADRWHPEQAAVTVRGRPGVLRPLGTEQVTLSWLEDEGLLMEAHGSAGASPDDVVAVAEHLRVRRP